MRAVIQRVSSASVSIEGKVKGEIGQGLMVLLGVGENDDHECIQWLSQKVVNMRIFSDEEGKMNRSLVDVGGGMLVVSQFTLHASTKKGNRPSFVRAGKPDLAIPLYEDFVGECEKLLGKKVETGEFGADMQCALVNDGPVTIIVDTKDRQ